MLIDFRHGGTVQQKGLHLVCENALLGAAAARPSGSPSPSSTIDSSRPGAAGHGDVGVGWKNVRVSDFVVWLGS